MSITTEGVIVHLSRQAIIAHDIYFESLPQIVRAQFVKNIKLATGDLETSLLPLSIKPVMAHLLSAAESFISDTDEQEFLNLFQQTLSACAQGWSHLSYWICTEQSVCYALFWSLKAAFEQYHQLSQMFLEAKNDGPARNDNQGVVSNFKITLIKDWLSKHS